MSYTIEQSSVISKVKSLDLSLVNIEANMALAVDLSLTREHSAHRQSDPTTAIERLTLRNLAVLLRHRAETDFDLMQSLNLLGQDAASQFARQIYNKYFVGRGVPAYLVPIKPPGVTLS